VRRPADVPVAPASRLKRVAIVAAIGVVTLNIWTGAPLLGLWVGSRVAPDSGISMGAVFVVIVVIGVAVWALMQLLYRLQAAYAAASGRPLERRQTTWLKPMSGERTHGKGAVAKPLSAVDYVVIVCVVLAVAAFEVWFFFFAGSPLPSG
jgi:hypothetical protein